MKIGLQLANLFLGFELPGKKSHMTISEPFTENVESGMPYRITKHSFEEIMGVLKGEYTNDNLVKLFGSISEIFSPIDTIVSRAVSGQFVFRKESNDEIIYDNPLLNNFLERPNPFQSLPELLYEMMVYYYINGGGLMYGNMPSTLAGDLSLEKAMNFWALPTNKITFEMADRIKLFSATAVEDVIQRYTLEKGTTNETPFDTKKVLYIRDGSGIDWKDKKIKPRSRLLSAQKAIANLIAVYEARGVIYLKRGAMGMWVSAKSDNSGKMALMESEKKAARKDMDEYYGLHHKKDLVGITSIPVEFVRTNMSIQEMMPFEETQADASAIYAVVKVPDVMMPGNKDSTFDNYRTAEISVYRNIAIPLAKFFCQRISSFLNIPGIYLDVTFDHIEVLQADKDKKSSYDSRNNTTWLDQFTNGIITLNTWRVNIGEDKITDSLYDKLVYEMSEKELEKVKYIVNLKDVGWKFLDSSQNLPNASSNPKNAN